MSVIAYGLRFRCDLCQVIADGPVPPPGDINWLEMPYPAGWSSIDAFSLYLKDMYGSMITHLCPGCSRMSIGDVANRLRELTKEKASHDG